MKILLIDKFHHLFGGAERAYFDTAETLKEAGHDVAFFSMQHPDNEPTPWSQYFVSHVDLRREDYSFVEKIKIAYRMIWNREAQKKLNALLDVFEPDVVHMHLVYHQISPSIIWTLKKRKIPMVMTLHDFKHISPNYNMLVGGKIWSKSAWHCVGDRCVKDSRAKSVICTAEHYFHKWVGTFEKIDVFVAPSLFLAKMYNERGFVKQIEHVVQPLQDYFFAPCRERDDKKKDTYILYFGRLSHEKGLGTLIQAFARSNTPKLVFVGAGDEEMHLRMLIQELGISERVHFAGYQRGEDLRRWICGAQATVMASACYENMPYALLEALASGVIVIAADLGGMPERITDGVNGFLYAPGDVNELVEKINRSSEIDRAVMAEAARASVADLRKNMYHERLMEIYELARMRAKNSTPL